MQNNKHGKNITKEPDERNTAQSDTSSEETINRGKSAIKARLSVDPRPDEIKQQEEKKDAEKWRNEG